MSRQDPQPNTATETQTTVDTPGKRRRYDPQTRLDILRKAAKVTARIEIKPTELLSKL